MVNGLSYSDYSKNNFDCGRFKSLSEINGGEKKIEIKSTTESTESKNDAPKVPFDIVEPRILDLRDEDDIVFHFNAGGNCRGIVDGGTDFFCGATVITDR